MFQATFLPVIWSLTSTNSCPLRQGTPYCKHRKWVMNQNKSTSKGARYRLYAERRHHSPSSRPLRKKTLSLKLPIPLDWKVSSAKSEPWIRTCQPPRELGIDYMQREDTILPVLVLWGKKLLPWSFQFLLIEMSQVQKVSHGSERVIIEGS